jgi:hypothetical protein
VGSLFVERPTAADDDDPDDGPIALKGEPSSDTVIRERPTLSSLLRPDAR